MTEFPWYHVGYRWWVMRHYWPARWRWLLKERLPWWIALRLPRKVALMAFVRVYGVLGECTPDYIRVHDLWEAKYKR